MIATQSFSLQTTPFTLVFGILLVLATIFVSWLALKRSGFRRITIVNELLRLAAVVLVAITLNQPEWVQQFIPKESPVLAVLWDQSDSMRTQDMLDQNLSAVKPLERQQWVEPFLDDEMWNHFGDRIRVVKQPFSSQSSSPQKASDLNFALANAIEKHKNLRGVVMFSDGDWNEGESPTVAATQLRIRNVPVFAVGVGSEQPLPDLEVVSLDAPTFGVVNKSTRIPFAIESSLPRAVDTVVSLTSSDGDELSQPIRIPANGRFQGAFTWKPKATGEYKLMLTVPLNDAERIDSNNALTVPIAIRKESLKVLLVESFPRWEYRYLRNALMRDPGVDVSCLLFHPQLKSVGGGKGYLDQFPQTLEELSRYDVIFLGDVGVGAGQLTPQDCRNIRGLVENQAAGLILMPGLRGRQFDLLQTELATLYPVHLDETQRRGWGSQTAAQFQLTEAGRESLLTKLAETPEANETLWESLPGFQWYAPVLSSKAGTQVLAVHHADSNEFGRVPLLVTKTFGTGKILFMGTDGAWRWREGVEDKFHYRFWGQVARWMAYQRKMADGEVMRLFHSPDRPKVGSTLTFNANVMNVAGEPLQDGTVMLQLIAPSGKSQRVRLNSSAASDPWGLFSGSFTPSEPGDYQAILTCRETDSTLETVVNVQGDSKEKVGKPANLEVMQEIAAITKGKMIKPDQIQQVFEAIEQLPPPEPRVKRIRLWSNPISVFLMVTLLSVFWISRKLAGTI